MSIESTKPSNNCRTMALEYKLLPGDYQSSAFDTRTSICLLCDRTFDLSYKLHVPRTKVDKLRQHLLIDHKFVISDIGEVIDLGGYLEFWRQKFALTTDLKRFCAVIRTNSSPNDCEESQVSKTSHDFVCIEIERKIIINFKHLFENRTISCCVPMFCRRMHFCAKT